MPGMLKLFTQTGTLLVVDWRKYTEIHVVRLLRRLGLNFRKMLIGIHPLFQLTSSVNI